MDRFSQIRQHVAAALREIAENLPGERLLVGKVMTREPITISMDATVLELVQLFHAKEFRHPLVTDHEGCLVGVVSDRDVIRCFGPEKYPQEDVLNSITTAEIMSTDLVTTSPETPLENAVELLFGYGINCLPVVSAGQASRHSDHDRLVPRPRRAVGRLASNARPRPRGFAARLAAAASGGSPFPVRFLQPA